MDAYDYWLVRGYAYVSCSGLGTAGSEGIETCGSKEEVSAFASVIDWMNGRAAAYTDRTRTTIVSANWATGNVAMSGQSYAGTTAFAVATTGVEPEVMGIGPISATHKALEKAGLTLDQIDLFEINEAFASQTLACQQELGIPDGKLNVNGGGISLGHPVGATGSRIVITLLYELRRRGQKYGVATLCAGGGMGTAVVVEAL